MRGDRSGLSVARLMKLVAYCGAGLAGAVPFCRAWREEPVQEFVGIRGILLFAYSLFVVLAAWAGIALVLERPSPRRDLVILSLVLVPLLVLLSGACLGAGFMVYCVITAPPWEKPTRDAWVMVLFVSVLILALAGLVFYLIRRIIAVKRRIAAIEGGAEASL